MKIPLREAVEKIFQTHGKIFFAEFVKRTSGETRRMTCRLGVKSYLKGGSLSYSPKAKKLVVVFDMDKHNYRMINLEGLKKLSIGKEHYEVK